MVQDTLVQKACAMHHGKNLLAFRKWKNIFLL
jgi:hypothetical protein